MPTAPNASAASPDDTASSLVRVGFIFRPHGIRGELKVDPRYTDDPSRFEEMDVVYVGASEQSATPHDVASVRFQQTKRGTTVILHLQDVDSREKADAITKQDVFVPEADLDLDEDEVFVHDVRGATVVLNDDTPVGTVRALFETAAHDILVVERPGGDEVMIPAVPDFIVDFDIVDDVIVVRPIDGLL